MVNDYAIVSPLPDGYKHTIKDIQGLNGCLDGINVRLDNITLNGGGGGGEGSSVDLSLYATKSWVGDNFSEYCHTHDCYACKDWVESEFSCKCHSHTGFSLEGHNHDGIYAPFCHTHDDYITENDLYNCLANYALTTWVENCFACKSHSHENYACKSWVETCFACKSHSHTEYSLKDHDHNGIYAPSEHTHDNYALKDHSHDCYVTEEELYNCLYNCLANYASITWVENCFACKSHNHDNEYIKRGEIDINGDINLENYATKDWAKGCFAPLKHNHDDIYALKEHDHDDRYIRSTGNPDYDNLANYATKAELNTSYSNLSSWVTNDYLTKNDALATYQPKGNYATELWVSTDYLTKNDALATYQPKGNYATEEWAKNCFAPVDHNHDDRYIRSTGNPDYDNLSIYATKAELNTSYSNLSSWVTNDYLTKTDASSTYAKKSDLGTTCLCLRNWVEGKNYLTEASLDNYACKQWVIDNYATTEWVTAQCYASKEWVGNNYSDKEHDHCGKYIPSTGNPDYDNLANYATKFDIEGFLTKDDADDLYAEVGTYLTKGEADELYAKAGTYLTKDEADDSYAALNDFRLLNCSYCSHTHDSYYAPLYRPQYETLPNQVSTYISIDTKVDYLVCAVRKLNCYLSSLNNGNIYRDKDCKAFYAFTNVYKGNDGQTILYNEIAQFNNWAGDNHKVTVNPQTIAEHENTVISE